MEQIKIENFKKNLSKIQTLDKEKIESILHALIDIKESLDRIYNQVIPELTKEKILVDKIQDLIWDIREEFRHIDYHIHDVDFLDL